MKKTLPMIALAGALATCLVSTMAQAAPQTAENQSPSVGSEASPLVWELEQALFPETLDTQRIAAFTGIDPQPAAVEPCNETTVGVSGNIFSYSDATYTTLVGHCRKLCCWTHWVCSGQVTGFHIDHINSCGE